MFEKVPARVVLRANAGIETIFVAKETQGQREGTQLKRTSFGPQSIGGGRLAERGSQ